MVEENLTDEQQANIIRQWLKENGPFVLGGLGVGLAALFGWDQWRSYEIQHDTEASVIYEELIGKVQINNLDEANALLGKLVADYSGSPYLDQAHLRLTKMSLDRNDFEAAASHLESVIAQTNSDAMMHIARIRLARIRLQQEQFDAALAALEGANTDSAFYARINDVRGDIYISMNRPTEALASYEAALTDTRQPPAIDRAYVQAKRDSLDVGDTINQTQTAIDTPNEADDASVTTE
jgi:predicted negative regulator of RcsB-dependent stress response